MEGDVGDDDDDDDDDGGEAAADVSRMAVIIH